MSGYLVAGFFVGMWSVLRYRPNVIHVHFALPAGLLAWIISQLTRIPYVLTSHLGDVPGGVPEKTDRWFKWAYPFTPRIWQDAAAVTVISEHTRDLALMHYPVSMNVILNGIELNLVHDQHLIINNPPRIVFVGRFVQQKNPKLIPQIMNELRDLEWHCVMVGDGALLDEIKDQINQLGLEDRFSLPGWRNPEEVNEILSKCDILFMPSRAEGIPLSGLQSLINGLAIVASKVGGMPHLVQNGVNGFLHDPDDIDGFKTDLRMYLQDYDELRKARLASLWVAKEFDVELTVKKYEELLLQVINQSSKVRVRA